MKMTNTRCRGFKVIQPIMCGCGCDQPNLSQYFLMGNKMPPNPQTQSQKLRSQNLSKLSKRSNIYTKTSINRDKISLRRSKLKLQSKVVTNLKMSYQYEHTKQLRVRYSQGCYSEQDSPIHNLRNVLLDAKTQQVIVARVPESSKNILKQNDYIGYLPTAQYGLGQLSYKPNKKVSLQSVISRLQQNGQKSKTKTENDLKNAFMGCSIDLQILKNSQKRQQQRVLNSKTSLNQIKPNEFLSPVKSLTSLGNWIETKSISDEHSQDSKQSVVLGRLSYPQLPVFKTFSRDKTATAASMINKIFLSGEATVSNQR